MSDRSGYVYLLKSPTGYYKIGRTKNPDDRRRTFNVKLPFEVEYDHLIECNDMVQMEKDLHDRYRFHRVNGEWFNLTDEHINWIKRIKSNEQYIELVKETSDAEREAWKRRDTDRRFAKNIKNPDARWRIPWRGDDRAIKTSDIESVSETLNDIYAEECLCEWYANDIPTSKWDIELTLGYFDMLLDEKRQHIQDETAVDNQSDVA